MIEIDFADYIFHTRRHWSVARLTARAKSRWRHGHATIFLTEANFQAWRQGR